MSGVAKKWAEPNPEASRKASTVKGRFFTLPPNSITLVRFMPPVYDSGSMYTVVMNHFNLKDDEGNDVAYGCLKYFKGEKCPACEIAEALFERGDKLSKGYAYDIKAKPRYYAEGYVKGEEDEGPRLFGFAPTMATAINSCAETLKASELPQFNRPYDGQWLGLKRNGSGINTDYDANITGRVESLDDIRPEWEDELTTEPMKYIAPRLVEADEMLAAVRRVYGNEIDIDELVG